ncbi:hypothetical protein SAMN05192563_1009138 [Paraburkholderia aspalathi]|jgi:hypothetical protein|uniref:Uncharacterized protein n=1 Tax=Paraburkholderia aspalathi TaxID=1324617 RepID=A0A1I7DC64_9BURK|nr:hypothetical protein SAMN05192563_1009138 [Paraburkholderia aspalathi]
MKVGRRAVSADGHAVQMVKQAVSLRSARGGSYREPDGRQRAVAVAHRR